MDKINLRSLLSACNDVGCKDGTVLYNVIQEIFNAGLFDGSEIWAKVRAKERFITNGRYMERYISDAIASNNTWRGEIKPVPKKYLDMLKPTRATKKVNSSSNNVTVSKTTKTSKTSSVKVSITNNKPNVIPTGSSAHTPDGTYSTRTILVELDKQKIYDRVTVLGTMKNLVNAGLFDQNNYDFFEQTFNTDAKVKKTIENCISGTKWSTQPLQAITNFQSYLPQNTLQKIVANAATVSAKSNLNNRSVLRALYKNNHFSDALKISATMVDLNKSGYANVNFAAIPNLASMNSKELTKLGRSAERGEGIFKGEKLVKDPILNTL